MVPEGWEKHPVGKICSSIVPGRNKPKVFDGNIPWVTTPEIHGRYIPSKLQVNYVSEEALSEAGGKIVPPGAVIMAAVGDLGLVAISSESVVLNQQLHAFVCSKKINNEYLAYWLTTQKPYMESVASKTTIPYMNKTNCESIPVILPPLPEQKKIAQILFTWDKAITTTEQLLANSLQQKKALMQQLLTGKKRLLDENGVRFPDWQFRKIGKFLKSYKELVPADTEFPILTSSRMGLYEQERSVINEGSYGVLPKGYFTYRHMSDDLIFKFNLNRSWEFGAISREYPVFKTDGLDSVFLEAQLNSGPAFKRFAMQQKQGGTRTRLYYKNLCEFGFEMPCLEEQRTIAAVLYSADQEVTVLQQKLDALKQEKKALMQQLLTGKRRVNLNA